MRVVASVDLGGRGVGMFLAGNHLLVFTTERSGRVRVKATLFDVTDRASPAVLRTTLFDGAFVDARRVGDELLVVTRSSLNVGQISNAAFSDDENRASLRARGLAALLPKVVDQITSRPELPSETPAMKCQNTFAAKPSDGSNVVLVHTLSIADAEAPLKATGIVANISDVYASTEAVYLASTESNDGGYFTPNFAWTRIHKLRAFQGDGAATLAGSVAIDGELHNQFSMDEQDGRLRVVVTHNGSTTRATAQNNTALHVFEEKDDELVEVGRVDDIGKGEAVQSVRFLGDKAYVVTYPFETAVSDLDLEFPAFVDPRSFVAPANDPLFVIDLADPVRPVLRGELEVPGYSTYIHPLGDAHLLTVGISTDPETNVYEGLQISVFDVSNPDAPRVVQQALYGDARTWSDALNDHHAFTFFAQQGVLALPYVGMGDSLVTSTGLAVFRVDPVEGIAHLGNLEQRELVLDDGLELAPQQGACVAVRRGLLIGDETGAFVYGVSSRGVTAAKIEQAALTATAEVRLGAQADEACTLDGFAGSL
jgi:hypothetical protein